MKLESISLLTSLVLVNCKINIPDAIKIAQEFALLQKNPTQVNAHVCWPRHHVKNLHLHLSRNLQSSYTFLTRHDLYVIKYDIHQLFIFDLGCKNVKKTFNEIITNNMLSEHLRLLVFNVNDVAKLGDAYLQLSNRAFFVQNTSQGVEINGVYKVSNTTKFIVENVYKWSPDNGITQKYPYLLPRNRSNLKRAPLVRTCVLTYNDSLNHLEDYRFRDLDPTTKTNWCIINYLCEFLNATSKALYSGSWGYYNETTHTFDGVIGDFQKGRAEVSATCVFIKTDRLIFAEYTSFSTLTLLEFLFIAPSLSYSKNIYTLPFQTTVWYSCLVIILAYLLVLYLIVYWEWRDPSFKEIVGQSKKPIGPSFFEVLICEIGVISQQGTEQEPKSISGRITLIIGLLSLMFIYLAYSANIVALIQSPSNSISTLSDLLNSKIGLGVDDILYNKILFTEQTDPLRKAIYEQKVARKGRPSNFLKTKEGVLRMKNEFFAFFMEFLNGYKTVKDTLDDNQMCNLRTIMYVKTNHPEIAVRRYSPYKEIIRVALRRMAENGQRVAEFKRIAIEPPQCGANMKNFVSIGLADTYFSFLLLIIGLVMAIITLLMEISYKRYVCKKN